MLQRVAKKNLKRQTSPQTTPDQQLAAALKSSRTILVSSLTQHWRAGNDSAVETYTLAFCRAAHFPQHDLMTSITSKYFVCRGIAKPNLNQFADELASLAWALCYAAPEVLLKYILQLCCEEQQSGEYLTLDSLGSLLEDMHSIPTLDTDARGVATALIQEIADYAAAIQPASPVALKAHAAAEAAAVPEKLIRAVSLESDGLSDLPELNVTVADMLHNNKSLFDSHGSDYEEDDRTTVGSYCSSELSEETALHIDTVVRFFKLRRSKLWALVSFQAQLRSVFFGERYWKQLVTSSRQPTVVAEAASILTLTASLRRMYMPEEAKAVKAAAAAAAAFVSTSSTAAAVVVQQKAKGLRALLTKRSERKHELKHSAPAKIGSMLSSILRRA